MLKLLKTAFACTAVLASQAAGEERIAAGRDLFITYCAACHGKNGQGGASPAKAGAPKPADLTKISQRRDGVWPMLEVMAIIDGYTKPVTPRAGMPTITELGEGAQIAFDSGNGRSVSAPARLVAVVQYLESIQSPKPERYVP